MEKQSDPKAEEDIEKLRRDYHELRDKLSGFRENDILALKEKISDLNLQFKRAAAVIIILGSILGFFGVKLYFFDLNTMVDDRIESIIEDSQKRTDKAISFNDRYIHASSFTAVRDYLNAIPIYEELHKERPEDERLFYLLLYHFEQAGRYGDGIPYIESARKNGLLPGQYKDILSYNNAGFFVLMRATEERSLLPQAKDLLQQAEEIGIKTGAESITLPICNLAHYYVLEGNLDEAKKYGYRCHRRDGGPIDILVERIQRVRPSATEEFKYVFDEQEPARVK